MVLEKGEKVHVISHRHFEHDLRRHFVGEVVSCTDQLVRVKGYTFVYDQARGEFAKKAIARIRIISLIDALNIINVIPAETDLNSVTYCMDRNSRLVVTDGNAFTLDINEFSTNR